MIEFTLYPKTSRTIGFAMQFSEESREEIEQFLKEQGSLDQFDMELNQETPGWVLYDNERSTMELVTDGDFIVYFVGNNEVDVYRDLDDLKRDYRLELS